MKVTVTFGETSVVVPCKLGWTVRDLSDQATRRYRRIVEQHGGSEVNTHHLEYPEGGILDMDDLVNDLVEDRDKLVAVFQGVHLDRMDSPRETMSNGFSSAAPSPEPKHYFSHLQYLEPSKTEIEVNEAILKANTPLLVRSSSDSAVAPHHEMTRSPLPGPQSRGSPDPEIDYALRDAVNRVSDDRPATRMHQVNFSTITRTVEVLGHLGPLGIHVVSYCSSLSGRTLGLLIKGIEEGGRSKRENLFQEDECIVQINDTQLHDKTFAESQDIFRQAMSAPSVRLEVLPVANKPRYEKSLIGQLFTTDNKDTTTGAKSPLSVLSKFEPQPEPKVNLRTEGRRPPDVRARTPEPGLENWKNAPSADLPSGPSSLERASSASPAGEPRSSPTLRTYNQNTADNKSPVLVALANIANKKGGKKINIDLKKVFLHPNQLMVDQSSRDDGVSNTISTEGLGFTVVTRDSSVHGPGPILVKNILPRGAAIQDGRLQPGDRIVEVNGVDMTGRTQEELVAMLRSTKLGESVSVLVARQDDMFLPRELRDEDASSVVLEDGREQLMYEIPLNESGSAGLGVSLKGNKSRETGEDMGIFIKSIIHGGAAYKDGRLNVNDQMIAVNGESLLGRSNHAAMETLRRSMSSEGNARGTIQLVVLRAPRQMGSANPSPTSASNVSSMAAPSSNQDLRSHDAYQRPLRPQDQELRMNGDSYGYSNSRSASHPYGHYGNNDQDLPPSPGRESPQTHHSDFHTKARTSADIYSNSQFVSDRDNVPRSRTSKSMDLVADESNMRSLIRQKDDPASGGSLGPTLGLMKSSSLESLQTAVSEAKQKDSQAQVPFYRPRPHMVRGRGCNQSFRIAIDKSYDGPSEDDDDMSEHSSGMETPASSSSRQDLDAEDGKKKKTKGKKKKKEKKSKGKKIDDSVDTEKKTKKKGFGILRFGKKKDDKGKDTVKGSKNKLEALSEEELDRIPDYRNSYEPRYAELHSGHVTPDSTSFPDMEDDDSDPNYARISNFRQAASPHTFINRAPSPAAPAGGSHLPQASFDDINGLYAKVNKQRPPTSQQNQHSTQADSDPRGQGLWREHQPGRAAPGYEELDAARRRVLDHDPHRVAPRGAESRPEPRYEEIDRQYPTQPRRDPYDYPRPRDPGPHYIDPSRVPGNQPQQRYYPGSPQTGQHQHRAAVRQDVPPSPSTGRRERHYYEAAGGLVDNYRNASPDRHVNARERYASPERRRYGDERQPDPRRKNPMVGAV
ncbi:par-3 family cell polarity regulator beta a isoform X1 [Gouania willdenowi]|uniref:par-3 family cell polarity regulator beta a isoform X1 n=2 Tax=Gouania willdenowi TaxID=441366 RepID=UPI001055C6AD|nr:partitioning defective 3 homolog B-like isoform X1 [Gouania willdenowi]